MIMGNAVLQGKQPVFPLLVLYCHPQQGRGGGYPRPEALRA